MLADLDLDMEEDKVRHFSLGRRGVRLVEELAVLLE
jgi:hypothetical protein